MELGKDNKDLIIAEKNVSQQLFKKTPSEKKIKCISISNGCY